MKVSAFFITLLVFGYLPNAQTQTLDAPTAPTGEAKDIPFIEKFIQEKLPKIKYVITHGKLSPSILENRFLPSPSI